MDSKEKTIELIEQALETVRPYLHADGGDVKLVELRTI
jgi:Fe-S cluster biogenesis protein NfuA